MGQLKRDRRDRNVLQPLSKQCRLASYAGEGSHRVIERVSMAEIDADLSVDVLEEKDEGEEGEYEDETRNEGNAERSCADRQKNCL